ncbi:MEDS domain-containing protein [Bacillus sp. JJ1609]|uniref:MEDS domain-containing protein n=1 Tax=Bacillus sp. JJ1609 TaxID=3122977 RepID=UPI002FFE92D5
MDNFLTELVRDLKKTNQGHIFYQYIDMEKYLQNALNFTVSAVQNGSHVLLVENDRNIIHLRTNLKKQLNDEQFNNIHFINNFDFYYANGDFHAQTIFDYFKTSIEPYLDSDVSVFTWGLIEWSDEDDITDNIEQYEKDIDMHIKDKGVISVCAYDANRTPPHLKEILMRFHGIMITDDQVHYLRDHRAM